MQFIEQHTGEIESLCRQHGVKRMYAFGSVLTNHFTAASDVDLIVDFNPIHLEQYADNYFDLKFALEDTLQRRIDLLEESAIKNPYFKQVIEKRRQIIYEAWAFEKVQLKN